ncbi:MAG: class II glutamine amidotransferase [Acidobacteriota bacterium]
MKLFACMCNQPKRLWSALAPVRAVLVAEPPVSRWGLGYTQGGDVLLVRTPKSSDKPVDLASPLAEIPTDCAIAQAVRDDGGRPLAGTDNTPPFRFRRWMFAQTGHPIGELESIVPRLLEHVPEYLRRNIKGRSPGELVFHVFLAMLHDEGSVDDPNLPVQATRRALAATLKLVAVELEQAGLTARLGNVALSNGRSMVLARQDEPLRLRRLWVTGERGERDDSFRGVLLVSGGDGDPRDGFEDVPAQRAVLVTRDLQVALADLSP